MILVKTCNFHAPAVYSSFNAPFWVDYFFLSLRSLVLLHLGIQVFY